jgi:phosphatidylserine decarboxylase
MTKPYFIVKWIINTYSRYYRIDTNEFDVDIRNGISFNDFFVRAKKFIPDFPVNTLCSPIDGTICAFGNIKNGMLNQVKGNNYSFFELTAMELAETKVSSYFSFYLSPADYHRVHAPFDLVITELTYLPGKLLSVNARSQRKRQDLFCRNERVVIRGTYSRGNYWLIMVGALNVGSIELDFYPLKTNVPGNKPQKIVLPNPISITRKHELGRFNMGSSVVLCFDTEASENIDFLNKKVIVGEVLYPF